MKKLLPFVLALIITTNVKAQNFYAQGGVNFANISTNANGDVQNSKTLTTFNVGLMNRFGISKAFDLETGVALMGQGAKSDTYLNPAKTDYVKAKFNPLYVQVPLNAIVQIPFGATKFFVSAGPYVAVGVGGKSKLETSFLGQPGSSESNIKFNNDDPTTSVQEGAAYNKLKRFDYGLNGGVGFDFSNFIVKANFGLGLAKINSTQTNNNADNKNKYRTVSVSVGIPLSR